MNSSPGSATGSLSVIVPCANEEGNVGRFASQLLPVLDRLGPPYELILVDDGSTDGTAAAMAALAQGRSQVRILRHDRNRGMGAALRTAFGAATGAVWVTLDADMSFDPADIGRLLEALTPGTDCVAGSPLLGRMRGVSLGRRLLSAFVNTIYRVLLRENVTAATSIFRAYRAPAVQSIEWVSNSFEANAEILFRMVASGAQIREVPVDLRCRSWGTSKMNVRREIGHHLGLIAMIMAWRGKWRPPPPR